MFFLLGQPLGSDRSRRAVSQLPGVSAEDIDKTFAWFARHGRAAVLLGRLVPVVRSSVSVPAGVVRTPWPQFLLCTALGGGLWNAALIAGGMLLVTQYRLVERYADWLNYGLVAAVVMVVGLLLARAVRRRARE